jgi:DNA-binding NarL/FixJ family response regulator
VVAGEAGVGKTRLAREVLAAAEKRQALVWWVVSTGSARALPLGAFIPALGPLGSDPMWLLRRAREELLAGAGGRDVVLGVDDAHLLDELSATLVHQLVLRREARVVLTLRTGEPAPDAVTGLWKDGHLSRLELRPLTSEVTASLLEEVLGGPVAYPAARGLWAITCGNVLYLRQLVEGELEAGRLVRLGGVWQWSGPPQLSPSLAELLHARIGQLSDAQRQVAEMLALGEPLSVDVLSRLAGSAAVERAEARGAIEVFAEGRLLQARLSHPLYGELLRARCGRVKARRLRGQIADALAAVGCHRADDALRRAVLMLDSDLEHDAELLVEAAERAAELCDPQLSERLARAAVIAGGGVPARFALCDALIGMPPLEAVYVELTALAGLVGTDVERTRVAAHRTVTLFWVLARPPEAESVLASALDVVTDPACRLVLSALQSVLDGMLCRPAKAVERASVVLAAPEPLPQAALIFACWGLALGSGALGRMVGLAEVMRRVDAAPDRFEAAHYRVAGVGNAWTRALRMAGLLAEAERHALAYVEQYQDAGGRSAPISRVLYGMVLVDRGRVRPAVRMFQDAGAELRNRHPVWSYVAVLGLALALGTAGDPVAARRALADGEVQRHPSLLFREPDLVLARAWVAAAEGAVGEACTLARDAGALAASKTQPAMEVVALHTAVCFGDRTVAPRLTQLVEVVEGPRAPAAAAHAVGLTDDDGDALLAASAQCEQMGALLLAADAAAHAAVAFVRRGRRGSAQYATIRAHHLAGACDGARTPALALIDAPPTLTSREREIVALAAGGLSNRAIADRLVISVRTVENHLYRACAKLGTSSRTEFAALLSRELE